MQMQPNSLLICESVQDLVVALQEQDITTTNWIKSPKALYQEIKSGDCYMQFEHGRLIRYVDVVRVHVYYQNENGNALLLVEDKQVFKNGKTRVRGFKYVAESSNMWLKKGYQESLC